jgi:hypothetical protein
MMNFYENLNRGIETYLPLALKVDQLNKENALRNRQLDEQGIYRNERLGIEKQRFNEEINKQKLLEALRQKLRGAPTPEERMRIASTEMPEKFLVPEINYEKAMEGIQSKQSVQDTINEIRRQGLDIQKRGQDMQFQTAIARMAQKGGEKEDKMSDVQKLLAVDLLKTLPTKRKELQLLQSEHTPEKPFWGSGVWEDRDRRIQELMEEIRGGETQVKELLSDKNAWKKGKQATPAVKDDPLGLFK